tara:strand:+ start:2697 stop:2903 length:207 start_codon:yes stop_codon:yes gene_type:complete
MTPEEIQGYLVIFTPLIMTIVAMSIFTLQDKKIKTYRLGDIVKDQAPKITPGKFDMQGTVQYTKGDNT